MSDVNMPRETDAAAAQTAGSSAEHGSPAETGKPENSSPQAGTYSWVSPRVRPDAAADGQTGNPWSGGNDGSFWRTADPAQTQGSQAGSAYGRPQGTAEGPRQGIPGGSGAAYGQEPRDKSRQNFADHTGRADRQRTGGASAPQRRSGGRRWGALIAMALVFGLIAGSTAYTVNLIGNRIYPAVPAQTQADDSSRIQKTQPAPTEAASSGTAEEDSSDAAATGPAQNPLGTGQSVADVVASTMPSLVTISTMSVMEMQSFFGGSQKYTAQGAGSGIIVGQNDTELLIATNNHVVEGATQLSVGFIDEEAAEASVKGTDVQTDLAVIAVKLEDIPDETMNQIKIASIGDSDALVLGEQIVAIGNALGYGQSVTSGYVSAFNRELNLSDGTNTFISSDLIQVDAAINSGNSGGALLNMRGELVGINEAKSSMTYSGATVDNVGYAIPINKAEPILEELMNEATRERYSEEEQGYLGVTCANVTSEYAQMYNLPEGVCFTSVAEDGPAGEAGIQKGDVLTTLDGKVIKTYEQLMERLTFYKAGETIDVVILRADNGEYVEHTMTVTLGSRDVLSKITGENPEDN